jgi:hypothetical protein
MDSQETQEVHKRPQTIQSAGRIKGKTSADESWPLDILRQRKLLVENFHGSKRERLA